MIEAADFISEKSYKAKGKRLTVLEVASITELKPLRFKEDIPPETDSTPGAEFELEITPEINPETTPEINPGTQPEINPEVA